MSRFDFTLKHVLGVRIGKTDELSWRLDLKVRVENDNKNQKLIKNKWIRDMMEVVVEEPEMILVEKIKNAREKDEEVIKVVEKMKKAEVKALRENKLKIEGELVRKEGKVYVLKDKELRIEVIWLHHDMLVAKYRERWKMIELVTRNY